jgi:hypothetical protein
MRQPFEADIRRSQREHEPGVLIGVRSICAYTRIGHHTFYQWCQKHGFPGTLTPDGRWITSKQLIDNWIVGRWKAQRATQQREREAALAGSGSGRAGQ